MIRSSTIAMLAWVAPALMIAGDVRAFPAPSVDLSSYKTFTLLPPKVMTRYGIQENEPTVAPLVLEALRRELTAKGLTEVSEGADLEVASGALGESIPQLEVLIYSLTFEGSSMAGTAPLATIGRYNREGTLAVNLIDPRINKSAWLGLAKRALGKPSKLKKDVDKAAQDLFKKYPALK